MLVIRMQRVGRKKLAHYRVVVQDSRTAPSSGRVIAQLGSHDPHAKTTKLNKEDAQRYLDNGAQPSERVAKMLKREGVKLPDWVKISEKSEKATKNPDKLRKNQPAEEVKEEAAPEEAPAEQEPAAEEKEQAAEEKPEAEQKEEKPTEEKAEESPEQNSEEAAPKEEATKEEKPTEEAPKEEPKEEAPAEETPKEDKETKA